MISARDSGDRDDRLRRAIGRFVERHPTVKMLARVSFLIGMTLMAEGFDQLFSKGTSTRDGVSCCRILISEQKNLCAAQVHNRTRELTSLSIRAISHLGTCLTQMSSGNIVWQTIVGSF